MSAKQNDDAKPFEEVYGKALTPEEVKEMKHNLVSYVQLLIQLDRQKKALSAKRKAAKENHSKKSQ